MSTDAGKAVIRLLESRKGFDYWWEEIDPWIRKQIVDEIDKLVQLREPPR